MPTKTPQLQFPDTIPIALGAKLSSAVAHTKNQIPKHHDNCEVVNLDPMSKGASTIPREILVRLPGGDGAEHLARWNGAPPNIEVGSILACREDPDHTALVVEGAGGGDAQGGGGAWPADDKVVIDATEFGSIEAAITASSSGDIFKLGPGTFTISASITITGRTFIGTGRGVTIISTTTQDVNLDDATLQRLTVTRAGTSVNDDTVQVSGSTGFTIQDCEILATGGGGRGVYSNAGTVVIENTDIRSTGAGSTRGVWTDSGATLTIRGGRVEGSEDVYINAGTVNLEGPELVNGIINGSTGVCWYYYSGRVFSEGASYTYPTEHFRSGSIPSSYSWRGSPFATPGTIFWSNKNDWMRCYHATVGTRGFLNRTVSSYVGKNLTGKASLENQSDFGFRVDDNSDLNYVEFRVHHTSGASFDLELIELDDPAAISTTTTTVYPPGASLTLNLFIQDLGSGSWKPICYVLSETGEQFTVLSGSTVSTWSITRAGLCNDGQGGANWDWFNIPT